MSGKNSKNQVVLPPPIYQLYETIQLKLTGIMKKELYKAYFALGIVSFFWGTTFIASRIGAQHMPGLFVSGLRQFISGSILVSYFLLKGYSIPGWHALKKISIQSVFLLCIANGLLTWSVEYISGGLAAIIAALVPLFIALFTVWLSKCQRITRWMLAGLIIGFAGVLVIFYDYLGQLKHQSFVFGVTLAIIATLSWSFGTVYTSRQKPPVDVLFSVGLQMLIAGIVVLLICGITGKYVNPLSIGQNTWFALAYLVVFGSLLAYSAYVFVIGKLPPTQVSVYAYINPLVAVLLGWLLLSEKMNGNMIIGTIITLAGVYLVNREFKKVKR
jgi:drug/metabolite transporter (DMT)-like permease